MLKGVIETFLASPDQLKGVSPFLELHGTKINIAAGVVRP